MLAIKSTLPFKLLSSFNYIEVVVIKITLAEIYYCLHFILTPFCQHYLSYSSSQFSMFSTP